MNGRQRKLASIQAVRETAPIPGADAIERISVLGWNLVARKGEFRPGDPCVYVEIDAQMPERPEFEFLRDKAFRIRTIRLRGQVSQGIAFPLSVLGGGVAPPIGTDVTEALGVVKYEPPLPATVGGEVAGAWPGYLFKTDEPRCQAVPDVLARHAGTPGWATEKVDGVSATFFLRDGRFGVCSRNWELRETPGNALWRMARHHEIEEKLRSLSGDHAVQAEVFGYDLPGTSYGLKRQALAAYSLLSVDRAEYEPHRAFADAMRRLEIPTVPILGPMDLPETAQEMLAAAEGKSAYNPALQREGIVWRPDAEAVDPDIGRLSIKAISNRFLLGER